LARDARLLAGLAAALAVCVVVVGAGSAASSSSSGELIEHWDGTAWTQVPVPGEGELSAVAAVSAGDVWAFGTQGVGTAITEHWGGSSWQRVALPTPKRADEVELARAAARSAADIWVVGSWAGPKSPGYRTLVEHWNGMAWTVVRSPNPTPSCRLTGVTAVSAQNAWAVGECFDFKSSLRPTRTLVLHWNGKVWTRAPSPNPSEANPHNSMQDDSLTDVDAASARNVWAVGTYFRRIRNGHHSYQTLVLHWNGKAWKQVPSPNPGGIRHVNELDAVAARSARDAWAVGGYRNGPHGGLLLAEHWNGRSWKVVSLPAPPTPATAYHQLTSVAALSGADVWASGWYLDDNGLITQPLVAHWNGNAWTLLPTPKFVADELLTGIAAVSADDVWAVGSVANP
jgi:photosystem II stability/assembly factor-like uncharacterized protein